MPAAMREARKAQGLSQAAAAARLGVSLRTYQGWEQGRGWALPPAMVALATLGAA